MTSLAVVMEKIMAGHGEKHGQSASLMEWCINNDDDPENIKLQNLNQHYPKYMNMKFVFQGSQKRMLGFPYLKKDA